MSWTDAQTERLKELFAEGYTCSQIAAGVGGVSRNAVIGKLHRLGLRQIKSLPKPQRAKRRRITSPLGTKRFAKVVRNAHGFVVLEAHLRDLPELKSAGEIIPESRRKTLMELTSRDCRFPFGDIGDPEFHFCGALTVPTYSYCAHHCRIAYALIPVRRDRVRVR